MYSAQTLHAALAPSRCELYLALNSRCLTSMLVDADPTLRFQLRQHLELVHQCVRGARLLMPDNVDNRPVLEDLTKGKV